MGEILKELEEAVFRHQKAAQKHDIALQIELTKEEYIGLGKEIHQSNTTFVNEVFTEGGTTLQIMGSKLIITIKE